MKASTSRACCVPVPARQPKQRSKLSSLTTSKNRARARGQIDGLCAVLERVQEAADQRGDARLGLEHARQREAVRLEAPDARVLEPVGGVEDVGGAGDGEAVVEGGVFEAGVGGLAVDVFDGGHAAEDELVGADAGDGAVALEPLVALARGASLEGGPGGVPGGDFAEDRPGEFGERVEAESVGDYGAGVEKST